MKWKIIPKAKICEAMSCIADGRIELSDNKLSAKVFSSSRDKFYTINYDGKNKIMCNDNASYFKGYLGYPGIAFLMLIGRINYDAKLTEAFKGIEWKKINTEFNNNWESTEEYALNLASKKGFNKQELVNEINQVFSQVERLDLEYLGEKMKPPKINNDNQNNSWTGRGTKILFSRSFKKEV